MGEAQKQIFIRGLSRSGGTLTVTLLDAHPDVAMSYELYESLLDPDDDPTLEAPKVLEWVSKQKRKLRRTEVDALPHKGLKTFLLRIKRGGLTMGDFEDLLRGHIAQGRTFSTVRDRLLLIGDCCALKMHREGKKHWGLKCNNRFDDYNQAFSQAYFVNVIRDGRDVLASQLNTGKFDPNPEELGRSWAKTHLRFRQWMRTPGARGYELFYERLAFEPEEETRKLCAFLGLPFEPQMLAFHDQDLTIFKAGHLSIHRISAPIDTKMIGRWRRDLSPAQAEAFCRGAHDAMVEFGYLEGATQAS